MGSTTRGGKAGWGLEQGYNQNWRWGRTGNLLEVLGFGSGVTLEARVVLLCSVCIATLSLISRLQLHGKKQWNNIIGSLPPKHSFPYMGNDDKEAVYPVVSLEAVLFVSRRTLHCILALWGDSKMNHIPNKEMVLTMEVQYLFAYVSLLFPKLFDRMVDLFVNLVCQVLVDLSN